VKKLEQKNWKINENIFGRDQGSEIIVDDVTFAGATTDFSVQTG
jgi:hypothetical protein